MKELYGTDFKEARHILKRDELLTKKMLEVPADYARFSVSSIGKGLAKIYIYPCNGENFTEQEADLLKDTIALSFETGNTEPPKDMQEWERDKYFWGKKIKSEEAGTIHWVRRIVWKESKTDGEPEEELIFLIENATKDNCKLIRKTKETVYYELDCGEDKKYEPFTEEDIPK